MDHGWKLVRVEPETVEVNGNGTNGNGHHDGFGIGPTVELVPVNGHSLDDGNGHHDEAEEPQQTLFS